MEKRILITGASGMVGNEILKQAFLSPEIAVVKSLVRKKSKVQHEKLQEYIIKDFSNYDKDTTLFENIDAAYFCIGAYTGQLPDALFKKVTVDYAVEFAKQVKIHSPNARLCLLSGAGADQTEKSRTSFARYKGMAENQITALGLEFYSLRPGYIYPVSPRKEPSFMYKIMRNMYPLIKLFGNKYSITSSNLAKAMFLIGLQGSEKKILENIDIMNFIEKAKK
jgi:uncharacterized protein YbjT (DUF2867 family)